VLIASWVGEGEFIYTCFRKSVITIREYVSTQSRSLHMHGTVYFICQYHLRTSYRHLLFMALFKL